MFNPEIIAIDRKEFEHEIELRYQWPFAAKSKFAEREKIEKESGLINCLKTSRTNFQVDIAKILDSLAYKKLERKTQIFISPRADYFITRHVHSIKTASIAQVIARRLYLCEDLVTAIAFGHDIGHAPFGHSGEAILHALMGIFSGGGFRHDIQGRRVVEKLSHETIFPENGAKQRSEFGLNLTREVVDGIAHHTKYYDDLRNPLNINPMTLEGQVVRIADDIAYLNNDINDAIIAGLMDPHKLADANIGFSVNYHTRMMQMIDDVVDRTLEPLKSFYNLNCRPCLGGKDDIPRYCVYDCQKFKDFIGEGSGAVSFSDRMNERAKDLWDFIEVNIHNYDAVRRRSREAKNYLSRLFYYYWSNPSRLSIKSYEKLRERGIHGFFIPNPKKREHAGFCEFSRILLDIADQILSSRFRAMIKPTIGADKAVCKQIKNECTSKLLDNIVENLNSYTRRLPVERIFLFEFLYRYPKHIPHRSEYKSRLEKYGSPAKGARHWMWIREKVPPFEEYIKYKRFIGDFIAGMTDRYALDMYMDRMAPVWNQLPDSQKAIIETD